MPNNVAKCKVVVDPDYLEGLERRVDQLLDPNKLLRLNLTEQLKGVLDDEKLSAEQKSQISRELLSKVYKVNRIFRIKKRTIPPERYHFHHRNPPRFYPAPIYPHPCLPPHFHSTPISPLSPHKLFKPLKITPLRLKSDRRSERSRWVWGRGFRTIPTARSGRGTPQKTSYRLISFLVLSRYDYSRAILLHVLWW